jgi:hypothetical protein
MKLKIKSLTTFITLPVLAALVFVCAILGSYFFGVNVPEKMTITGMVFGVLFAVVGTLSALARKEAKPKQPS